MTPSPLRSYRIAAGLSPRQAAQMLGIAESTLRSLENGWRKITGEMAVHIEQRIGCRRELLRPDLFSREQNPEPRKA